MSEEDSNQGRLKILESLVARSEERNEKINEMLHLLIQCIAANDAQRADLIQAFERRLLEAQKDKEATVQRLERRIEKAEKRYEEVLEQTQRLVAMLTEKDKQIGNLEDRLMLKHSSVNIGGITTHG